MPTFINPNTGFPDETPCIGCGWPLYCCLCPADDQDETESQLTPVAANLATTAPDEIDLQLKDLLDQADGA